MNEGNAQTQLEIREFFSIGLPIVAVVFLAIVASQISGWIAAVGVSALILLGAGAVGGGLGFLFALPRVLTKADSTSGASGSAPDQKSMRARRLLGSNTNLEQVSDWLTTMIVGVGLTQLSAINGALFSFRMYLQQTATVFAQGKSAGVLPAVGPLILLVGLIFGFVFVYLYTRIIISALLNRTERVLFALTTDEARAVKVAATRLPGAEENPALKTLVAKEEPSVFEGIELMGSMLYQPGRYQDVIDLGGKLSNSQAKNRGEYWLYLAAAFGQKYHDAIAQSGPDRAESAAARSNALDCARRAAQLDPSMKARLWYISDRNGEDDDLADLREDEEFRKIVGRESMSK